MKRPIMLLGVCVLVAAGSAVAENAWIRFTPERPGVATDPAFTNGWQAVEQFEFAAPEPGAAVAVLGFTGPVGPATPLLMQDVLDETLFDAVEVVLLIDGSQTRLLLERVRVAAQNIHWEAGATSPREERLLSFGAITYIYEPADDEVGSAYSETDIATGSGGAGDYIPRDPDVTPVFGATLTRDPALTGQFALSWESDPGIQYTVEFTDDLTDPESWQPLASGQEFTGEGRRATLNVTEPRGFYRIRER